MTADEKFMREAIKLARRGAGQTRPNPAVGCVLVKNGRIIARGYHRRAGQPHAEIEALRTLKNPDRARGATAYVTLEPCIMCAAALVHARVDRVVFGAWDPKAGGAGSIADVFNIRELNHRVDVFGGVLAEECGALLSDFFRARRQ
jgi:tRNA(adenine34) deaminase